MTATDQLVEDYLDRLETAARALPRDRRAELLAEIKEHIGITLSQEEDQGEATVRTILDRLGSPEDIVREAGTDLDAASPPLGESAGRSRVGAVETITVILLLIGGIVLPVLGWIVGVVLLWSSARWTTRDKAIGTLVVPGGLAFTAWSFLFWTQTSVCSSDGVCQTSGMPAGLALTLALVATAGSIGSAVYLLHRAKHAVTWPGRNPDPIGYAASVPACRRPRGDTRAAGQSQPWRWAACTASMRLRAEVLRMAADR